MKSKEVLSRDYLHVHLTQSYLPGGGGLEQSISNIITALSEPNSIVVCISSGDKEKDGEYDRKSNIKIVRSNSHLFQYAKILNHNFNSIVSGNTKLSAKGKLSMLVLSALSTALLLGSARRVVKRSTSKSVIITAYSMNALLVAIILRTIMQKNIKIIFSNHFAYTKSGFKPVDLILRIALKEADYTISVSNYSKAELIRNFGVNEIQSHVCYNWIDLKVLPYRQDYPKNNPKRLLFVGRIVPEKGIRVAIEFAKYIKINNIPYEITVIGDSNHPIKNELINLAETNNRIRYLGRVDKPEIWKHYMQSDYFFMPVQWEEGFGNVILEAYAFGLPVIGTARGAIPEIVGHFAEGKIIHSSDPREIIQALSDLGKSQLLSNRVEVIKLNRLVINKYFSSSNRNVHESINIALTQEKI